MSCGKCIASPDTGLLVACNLRWSWAQVEQYARALQEHQPCIIFMDEIDAIGGRRFSEGTSADREIQRTLMELLSQLDGFDVIGKVKMIMATNRCAGCDLAVS